MDARTLERRFSRFYRLDGRQYARMSQARAAYALALAKERHITTGDPRAEALRATITSARRTDGRAVRDRSREMARRIFRSGR